MTLTPEQVRGEVTLDLGKVVATAEVRVNGQMAGIRVAPPWRVDISKQVKPGENRIEVLVSTRSPTTTSPSRRATAAT